jgi:hypothetical protein
MLALGQRIDHKCPCGKDLRHRGSCQFRQTYRADREKAGADNQTKGNGVLRTAKVSSD